MRPEEAIIADESQDSLPKTVLQAIEGMALRFNPDEAKGLSATIQFNVSPSALLETGGEYYLSIADGKCDFSAGTIPDPTLTISTPADVWLKIARKEMSGTIALLTGKYRAQGQMGLLLKMDKLFSRQAGMPTVFDLGIAKWTDWFWVPDYSPGREQ